MAVVPALDHVLPTGLALPSILVAGGQGDAVAAGDVVTAVAGTCVLIAACVGGAIVAFGRREL